MNSRRTVSPEDILLMQKFYTETEFSYREISNEVYKKTGHKFALSTIYNYTKGTGTAYMISARKQMSKETRAQLKKKLSFLITSRLEEIRKLKKIGRGRNWLANELGISRQMVSLYVNEKALPSKENFRKMCSVLEIRNDKSLEDLLKLTNF